MGAALSRRLLAEGLGTAFLLATVIGSGIMADHLAGENVALALLCNTLPTGAILFVLITAFGPVSGAHFNPAVTGVFFLRRELPADMAAAMIAAQCAGALGGSSRRISCSRSRSGSYRRNSVPDQHSGFPSGSPPSA
jgi:glycerol uptake facilitator-like aquaporin